MNDELKQLLGTLPEGILIYDAIKRSVVMTNEEYRRVFKCQESDSSDKLY